jgi:hypothetical protein
MAGMTAEVEVTGRGRGSSSSLSVDLIRSISRRTEDFGSSLTTTSERGARVPWVGSMTTSSTMPGVVSSES